MRKKALFYLGKKLKQFGLLSAFIMLSAVCFNCPKKTLQRSEREGDFYSLKLPQVEGVEFPFSVLRGKVVAVDFFASFCAPCLVTIPKLKKIYHQYRKRGFLVLGIALEKQVKKILIPYIDTLQIDYPVLVATEPIYKGKSFFGWILEIPRTYLIDRCGNIRKIYIGPFDERELSQMIKKLLDENKENCLRSTKRVKNS